MHFIIIESFLHYFSPFRFQPLFLAISFELSPAFFSAIFSFAIHIYAIISARRIFRDFIHYIAAAEFSPFSFMMVLLSSSSILPAIFSYHFDSLRHAIISLAYARLSHYIRCRH